MTAQHLEELGVLRNSDDISFVVDENRCLWFFPLVLPVTETQYAIVSQTARNRIRANFGASVAPGSALGLLLARGEMESEVQPSKQGFLTTISAAPKATPVRIGIVAKTDIRLKHPPRLQVAPSLSPVAVENPLLSMPPDEAKRCMLEFVTSSESYARRARAAAKLLERGLASGRIPDEPFVLSLFSSKTLLAAESAEELRPVEDVEIRTRTGGIVKAAAGNVQHLFNSLFGQNE
jgi:hypothetical protein